MFQSFLLTAIIIIFITFSMAWLIGERGSLIRPSTRAWLKEGGIKHFLSGAFFHGYAYSRWSDLYIGQSINNKFPRMDPDDGKPHWATKYNGKVIPTDLAKRLITVDKDIRTRDLEQIIPYPAARQLVLQGSPDIAIYRCPCRMARENPCEPLDVCMIVGQPFVDFIVEHHPETARKVSQSEAIAILEAEHQRGHIHAAYFKDVMLNRFYAICNCCGCCCGGIEAMRDRGVPMVTASGYVAQVDEDLCIACGDCAASCPFRAIEVNITAVVDVEQCMGCSVCVDQCTNEGISLVVDEWRGIKPLNVDILAN